MAITVTMTVTVKENDNEEDCDDVGDTEDDDDGNSVCDFNHSDDYEQELQVPRSQGFGPESESSL